jgi:hypothetical protein
VYCIFIKQAKKKGLRMLPHQKELTNKARAKMLEKIRAVPGTARISETVMSNGTIVYRSKFTCDLTNDELELSALPGNDLEEEVMFCDALNKGVETSPIVLDEESFNRLLGEYTYLLCLQEANNA